MSNPESKFDKKKVGIMIALLLVGLLLWGRLLIKKLPRTAVAEPAAAVAAPTSMEPIAADRVAVVIALPDNAARDLFAIDPAYYEQVEGTSPTPEVDSRPEPADVDVRTELMDAIDQLTLHSTMGGNRPRALINGRIVKPGEEVLGFVLKEVKTRKVILQYKGLTVQLGM
ncbi:MAG: hypothetical protein CMJ18_01855 [Phycisphaeraceae bacterium]|nr:hypothetical protein [Phycisphaeraceae bacterium]